MEALPSNPGYLIVYIGLLGDKMEGHRSGCCCYLADAVGMQLELKSYSFPEASAYERKGWGHLSYMSQTQGCVTLMQPV